MRLPLVCRSLCLILIATVAGVAIAHVPYLERRDFTFEKPFDLGTVEQSKAIYAWLESETDVDVYQFEVTSSVDLFAEVIVPACPEYKEFAPWFAVVGPGLPAPGEPLPVDLPEGYGAVIKKNTTPPEEREVFFEPFGGKSYYQGPTFEQTVEKAGTWWIVYWDPDGKPGDYVASIGKEEDFSNRGDILRSLVNTAIIRSDGELHTECQTEDTSRRLKR